MDTFEIKHFYRGFEIKQNDKGNFDILDHKGDSSLWDAAISSEIAKEIIDDFHKRQNE